MYLELFSPYSPFPLNCFLLPFLTSVEIKASSSDQEAQMKIARLTTVCNGTVGKVLISTLGTPSFKKTI